MTNLNLLPRNTNTNANLLKSWRIILKTTFICFTLKAQVLYTVLHADSFPKKKKKKNHFRCMCISSKFHTLGNYKNPFPSSRPLHCLCAPSSALSSTSHLLGTLPSCSALSLVSGLQCWGSFLTGNSSLGFWWRTLPLCETELLVQDLTFLLE